MENKHLEKRYLNIKETSTLLDIKISTLYCWISQHKIPYIKIGKLVKFDTYDIGKWLETKKIAEKKLI